MSQFSNSGFYTLASPRLPPVCFPHTVYGTIYLNPVLQVGYSSHADCAPVETYM